MIAELTNLSRGRGELGADAGTPAIPSSSANGAVTEVAASAPAEVFVPDQASANETAIDSRPTFIAPAAPKFGDEGDLDKAAAYAFGESPAPFEDAANDPPETWSDTLFAANQQVIRSALEHNLIGSGYAYAVANGLEEFGDVREPIRAEFGKRNMPEWVLDELTEIALAGAPIPFDKSFGTKSFWVGRRNDQVNTLAHAIAARLPERVSHIILTPWLDSGGAERVALWHALAVDDAGGACVVMGTDRQKEGWVSRLPDSATYICLNQIVEEVGLAGHLGADDWAAALGLALSQTRFDVMHVINSYVATRMLRHPIDWGKRRIFYSLFGIGVDKHELEAGFWFGARDLRGVTDFISDNAVVPNARAAEFGLDPKAFRAIDYPVDATLKFSGVKKNGDGIARVLWASRLDPEKQPEIVFEIARAMPDVEFHMFGSGILTDGDLPRPPRNVWLRGPFDGWSSLPAEPFDCFLMTSRVTEGMPNIVLEAMGSALPVVASSVGAVPEALANKRGWLVDDITSWNAYVATLRSVFDDPQEARRRARAALLEVTRNRTFKKLTRTLSEIGYL